MDSSAPIYRNVVVIDDSEMDVLLMKIILKSVNYAKTITVFNEADKAISYFRELDSNPETEIPEVVFLDINMPEINGFEFLDIINNFPGKAIKKMKFIIISSSDDIDDLEQSKKYKNIIKYLVKPLDKNELLP